MNTIFFLIEAPEPVVYTYKQPTTQSTLVFIRINNKIYTTAASPVFIRINKDTPSVERRFRLKRRRLKSRYPLQNPASAGFCTF